MDYIIANDLAVLRSGKRTSHIIEARNLVYTVDSADEIGEFLIGAAIGAILEG